MLVVAKAVADDEGIGGEDRGYRLVLNVGPDALNSVDHLHLHLLGGRAFDWPPAEHRCVGAVVGPARFVGARVARDRVAAPDPLVGSEPERTWQAPRSRFSFPATISWPASSASATSCCG